MSTTHINIRPGRHGKLHDAREDCWCGPTVSRFQVRGEAGRRTVIDHHDGIHQQVSDELRHTGALGHEPRHQVLGARKVG